MRVPLFPWRLTVPRPARSSSTNTSSSSAAQWNPNGLSSNASRSAAVARASRGNGQAARRPPGRRTARPTSARLEADRLNGRAHSQSSTPSPATRPNSRTLRVTSTAPRVAGLVGPIRRFRLAQDDFDEIISGMMMDAEGDIRAPDWPTLDRYCDRVASAVGRLAVRIFGVPEEYGPALAHHLGRALQLTNILRDLDEDAAIGRLYLPREALNEAGIASTDPAAVLASPALGKACAAVVARAETHFEEADKIMARSPRRAVKAPRIMAAAYRPRLALMVERGWDAPREKVSIARSHFLWILLRYAIV